MEFDKEGGGGVKVVTNKTVDFNEDGTVQSVDLQIVNLNRERKWENIGEFRGEHLHVCLLRLEPTATWSIDYSI